jgi:hypothetical protein
MRADGHVKSDGAPPSVFIRCTGIPRSGVARLSRGGTRWDAGRIGAGPTRWDAIRLAQSMGGTGSE